MNREQWKDWFEAIGILGIIGSLLFVGLQMRQSQSFALAEAEAGQQTIDNRAVAAINEYPEIWARGAAGEDLTRAEAVVFRNLVEIASTQSLFSYTQRKLLDHPRADLPAHRFAFFLYQNPGARQVWLNFIRELELADAVLGIDTSGIPEWREIIRMDLTVLDQSDINAELTRALSYPE